MSRLFAIAPRTIHTDYAERSHIRKALEWYALSERRRIEHLSKPENIEKAQFNSDYALELVEKYSDHKEEKS